LITDTLRLPSKQKQEVYMLWTGNIIWALAKSYVLARWSTLFSPENAETTAALTYPIWVQIQGLGKHLRNTTCLPILAAKLEKVLKVETLETYKAKTAGYRIKILRNNIHDLPTSLVIPGEKPGEATEHGLLFSGLPDQCRRWRKFGHMAKHCDKPKNSKEGWKYQPKEPSKRLLTGDVETPA